MHGIAPYDARYGYGTPYTTCSRPHFTQMNISLSKSRVRLADSICLSRNSLPQRSQCDEGGGSTRVRIGFPFARNVSERGGRFSNSASSVWFRILDAAPRRVDAADAGDAGDDR